MNMLKTYAPVWLVTLMLSLLTGCTNDYALKKQALEENWGKAATQTQLPIVEDHINQGRLKQARELLAKCMKSDPESAQAYYLAGRIHEAEGQYDKAAQAFQKAVELNPQTAAAWHALGSLAVVNKQNESALEHYRKAQQLEPLHTEYLLSLADLYVETQQMEQAGLLLEEGLDKQPRNLEWMLSLAALERQRGRSEEAVKLYEQALLIHGKRPEILEPCGYMYCSLQQWGKAADRFAQLVKLYPEGTDKHTLAMRSLAKCSLNAGQYSTALKYYDKLSVVCRDDADIWLNMAQSALGADDPQRASLCAEKALRLQAGWSAAYAMLGSAQYLQNQHEKAILSFDNVTDDEELAAYAWFMTGRCYQKLGQNIQANTAFDKAEQLDPTNELVTLFLKRTMKSL